MKLNPVVISNARILGAKRPDLLLHIYFPAATSWIFSSSRTLVGFCSIWYHHRRVFRFVCRLGYLIAQAEGNFDAVGVLAGFLILAMLVFKFCCSGTYGAI